jgi:arylsulfatase A-like enzyme
MLKYFKLYRVSEKMKKEIYDATFSKFIIAVISVFLFFFLITPVSHASSKPNVVLIIADDMGWLDTGYSGNTVVKTPALDSMASNGIRFDYFYAAGPVCCPGRYAILTGRAPYRGGMHMNLRRIRQDEIILPRALKLGGYRSALFGKWHIGSAETNPVAMGYDQATWASKDFGLDAVFHVNDTKELLPTKGESSLAVMDLALQYIRTKSKEPNPFFVTVAFGSPHIPHTPAPEFKALYPKLNEKLRDYYGEISGMDSAIGKLRDELRALNIAENTLIWFMSDNGGHVKEALEPNGVGKGWIGSRTASVLEWPGHVKPMQSTMPCVHMDVYPTILELADIKVPDQPILDGVSLKPLLSGAKMQRPSPIGFVLWQGDRNLLPHINFPNETHGIWIDGKYKLIIAQEGSKEAINKGGTTRLYDIYADPADKNNLLKKLPDLAAKMRQALDQWRASVQASLRENLASKQKPQVEEAEATEDHSNDHRH